jgi:hypothetical protein
MPKPKFKQRCAICKNNMVIMYSYRQFPICVDCHMKQINQEIEDPKMKKFFDHPKSLYEKSSFLRNIKQAYIRFGNLSEKQVEAFKKTVKDLKNPKKEEVDMSDESENNKTGEKSSSKLDGKSDKKSDGKNKLNKEVTNDNKEKKKKAKKTKSKK